MATHPKFACIKEMLWALLIQHLTVSTSPGHWLWGHLEVKGRVHVATEVLECPMDRSAVVTLSAAPKHRASKFPLRTPAQRLLCPDGRCFRSWPHSKELLVPPGWEEQQLGGHQPEGASAQGFSWDLWEFDILFWSSVTVTYQGVC